jgi:hypothetical protein
MRRFLIYLHLAAVTLAQGAYAGGWEWFAPELRQIESERQKVVTELQKLGSPMVGQTTAEIGYQREHMASQPPSPPRVQIDLPEPAVIDSIALIPAVVDWRSADPSAYAFALPGGNLQRPAI